jgi:putative transposase
MQALQIGGVADHVHMLLSLPATLSVSKAMQLIKGNSSKWVHENFPEYQSFEWQEGYGAFSIGVSGSDGTIEYIKNQIEHHKRRTFQDEPKAILKRHAIQYEDWMLD